MEEVVDLDLLSLYPQKDARFMGGRGRKQSSRGQQWRGKPCSRTWKHLGKKDPFIGPHDIQPLWGRAGTSDYPTDVGRVRRVGPKTAPSDQSDGFSPTKQGKQLGGRTFRRTSVGPVRRVGLNRPGQTSPTVQEQQKYAT